MNQEVTSPAAGFQQFSLNPKLMRGIEEAGFETPRPIQAQTIPPAIEGRDILGLAQTGTGKTAAFVVPIIERLLAKRRPGPSTLVLAPTRELATQIHADFENLAKHTRLKAVTVYGGVSEKIQTRELRKQPEVIIACPGRLLDLSDQGKVMLGRIQVLVLDEADQMFDMGFLPDIKSIISSLPSDRQNLLFAATMPKEIRGLANQILDKPFVVELAHSKPASTIEHILYDVPQGRKVSLLEHLLRSEDCESAIVFSRTKHRAKRLGLQLEHAGHSVIALQGNMSQPQRDRALKGFRSGQYKILVATDIASRGIDVAGISHVINFDVPNSPESYTHRIGRTGRSEREGKACTFATPEDTSAVRSIERGLGAKIRREPLPEFSRSERRGSERGSDQRRGDQRPHDESRSDESRSDDRRRDRNDEQRSRPTTSRTGSRSRSSDETKSTSSRPSRRRRPASKRSDERPADGERSRDSRTQEGRPRGSRSQRSRSPETDSRETDSRGSGSRDNGSRGTGSRENRAESPAGNPSVRRRTAAERRRRRLERTSE